jgi:hypothetical protein
MGMGTTSDRSNHDAFADALKRRVLEDPCVTGTALRQRVAARVEGGPPIEPPYDELARQIEEASYRTTNSQVASVLSATGSEKAAFEIIATAATAAA